MLAVACTMASKSEDARKKQKEVVVKKALDQGVLDDQFSQLILLQDESQPEFVAEVCSPSSVELSDLWPVGQSAVLISFHCRK